MLTLKKSNLTEGRELDLTVRKRKYKKQDLVVALIFAGPTFLGLILFYIIPMFQTIYYSFTEWGMFGGNTFTGLENYKSFFSDPQVLGALKNTATYGIFTVPISVVLAITIATLLNNDIKGRTIYRLIYFLPAVTMTAAVAMVWQWIFHSQFGLLNHFLGIFGIDGPAWITDPQMAMISLIIVGVWGSIPSATVIYLSGLQGIPNTLYEAGEMDGATSLEKFFYVTLPLLTPTMFFNLITSLISALQIFDLIFLMFSETNPALSSVQSLSYLFYRQAFIFNNRGYGAAILVVLLSLTLIITVVNFSLQKKWVHYN